MSDISEWSTKEPENTHLDELTLSGEGGRYINKIMCAVKAEAESVDDRENEIEKLLGYESGNKIKKEDTRSGSAVSVLCGYAAGQVRDLSGSAYECLRLYHFRDINKDNNLTSYRYIGTSRSNNDIASGGVTAIIHIGSTYENKSPGQHTYEETYRWGTSVVFDDESEATYYGKTYTQGDVIDGKTVVSAENTTLLSNVSYYYSVDNACSLGKASKRFSTVYAETGEIDTSDERLKTVAGEIPDAVLDAWGSVGWVMYQFKDAVAAKGAAARLHAGAIAQRIDEAFSAQGLDASRFGLFCRDEWTDEDEGGQGQTHDRYALRYTEALCVEAAYQRRRADRLEARLEALEARFNGID